MQYRPFWWSLFHPRLTAGIIVVVVFLLLTAVLNSLSLINALSRQSMVEAAQQLLAAVLYAVPAVGLLRLKRWARLFEIGYSILLVALGLFIMFAANLGMGMFMVVTHGLVGIYLLSARCRRVFYPSEEDTDR